MDKKKDYYRIKNKRPTGLSGHLGISLPIWMSHILHLNLNMESIVHMLSSFKI